MKNEKKTIIFNKQFISSWEKKIKNNMKIVRHKILDKVSNNWVYGYGSPTKIILFLKMLDLPKNKIKFIFEDNKLKQIVSTNL